MRIGLEVAKTFKKHNSIVVMTYYEEEKQQENLMTKLIEKYKFDLGLGIDVTKTASVQDCFTRISEKFGRIDILVNNAGINLVGDFDKIDDEMWKKVIDTNLKGPFICMREVYEHMSEGGKVINLGSVSGQYGGPRTTSYACAKAGIMALTHCYARYAGPRKNISVNCVAPGPIASDMLNLMKKTCFQI